MTAILSWLSRVLRVICVALFAALVLLVVWQVFTRLVLNDPSPWTEEAARFTFVWVSLIGIAIATGEKADVVMDFLVEKLPRRLQRGADIIAYLCTLFFALLVMVFGGLHQVALAWTQTNPVLPFTQGQLYLALPISGILLSLFLIVHIINALSRSYIGHIPQEDEEAASI
jgi:TRAP-type C4-dicarboxylate transport system permease small subunit